MAISRIRGEQIKDIVLKNAHIAPDAAIEESKLAVDWAGHYQKTLMTKKVVDYVQVNGTEVDGLSSLDITAIIPASIPNVQSDPLSGEGVIIDAPKNKAQLRDSHTGDPVLDEAGQEVFGRVTFEGGIFVLKFYVPDGAGEKAFTMEAGQDIDWQYAKRFNLETVSEMFAANEKFVEGAADATAHLNINQLAQDIYGAGFSLDRDGNANLSKSLSQQISDEITARTSADQAIREALASTAAGKGASTIGVEDAAGNFTGATVESILAEIDTRLKELANGGTTTQIEVNDAHSSTLTGDKATLDERLEADTAELINQIKAEKTRAEAAEDALKVTIDQEVVDRATAVDTEKERAETAELALSGRADALEAEVTAARGTAASIDARLDRALNEDGTLKASKDIHSHPKAYFQAVGGETKINLANFNLPELPAYQVGNHTLDVYVNGILQNEGLHYAEVAGGLSIDFGMGDGTALVAGDIITIRYQINLVV